MPPQSGQFSAADIDAQPQQGSGQFSAADVGMPAPPTWLDTAERYASDVGGFIRSLLPKGEEPPPPPAHTLEEWQNLPDAEKQAYHDKMTQWEQGQIKGAGNLAAGFMTPGATGLQDVAGQPTGLIEGWLKNSARKLYQSALKPSTTIPEPRIATAVDTAIQNRIPVTTKGLDRLGGLLEDLQNKVSQTIQQAGPGRTISPGQAAKDIGQVRARFATQVNPNADLAAIDAAKNEFLDQFRSAPGGAVRNMTAAEAQAMKQGTYAQLKSRSYGELKSATIEAQKALARGIKEELARQFPELSALNARESAMYNLEPMLERAVQRISNHQVIGIGTPIAAAGAKAVGASYPGAAAVGVLKAVVDDPAVKSKLAMMLDAAAKRQGITGLAGQARLAGWLNALARGAMQQSSPGLSGQASVAAAQ